MMVQCEGRPYLAVLDVVEFISQISSPGDELSRCKQPVVDTQRHGSYETRLRLHQVRNL